MKETSYLLVVTAAVTAVLLLVACGGGKRAELKASKADSLLYDAGKTRDYDRVLATVDSLERRGDMSAVNINRWRGVAYYYKGQMRTAEYYYKKAVEADIRSEQDELNYYKSARRLAGILVAKGDYEQALRVALPALAKMEESNHGSAADFATLQNTIGCCQLNLGRTKEADISFDRAYRAMKESIGADGSGRQVHNVLINTISVVKEYLSVHQPESALLWIERTAEILQQFEPKTQTELESVSLFQGQIDLYRAVALQGVGRTGEAANSYREAKRSQFGRSLEGRLAANDYLLAAHCFREAADNNRDLDRLLDETGMTLTLDNIQQYLLPKFRANVGAQRKDSAIATGERICDALDSAIVRSKRDDAAELATIYGTQEKEAQIVSQQAHLTRLQFFATAMALVLVVIFFTVYTLHKRKATHHLAIAHAKLQAAYDQLEETTAAKERIESELRIARDIQMSMVPNVFPDLPGLDLYASMTPAKEVGGDLYGYLLLADSLYFCIGDVSGKGVPASLFMAQATRLFRTLATQMMMPAEIATRMNNALTEDNEQGMFVTMFIGLVNLHTGHLDFCNAGHNPPVIIDQSPRFLDMLANPPIGLWPGVDFEGECVDSIMEKPLFVYTDGLTEAENQAQKQFGEERLLDILKAAPFENAKATIMELTNEVVGFRNGADPNDDLTMLCLNINKPLEYES